MADGPGARSSVGRRLRRGAVAFALTGLLLAGAALPLAAPIARAAGRTANLVWAQPAAAPPLSVAVTLTDAPAFVPANVTANASQTVVFVLRNSGTQPHTFTLARTPNAPLNRSWTPAQLDAFFAKNGSLANVSLAPGQSANATVAIPATAAGQTFAFVSLVPYQFQAGMHGNLTVVSAPTGKTYTASVTTASGATTAFVPTVVAVNGTFPASVTVTFTDAGVLPHTFTLSPLPNVTLSPSNFTSFFAKHPPLADISLASTGQSGKQTFVIPKTGIYEYICKVPGHFAAGMNGSLFAGIAPVVPVAPSTAIVQAQLLVAAGALFVIGIILALVAAYTGRFTPSPVERDRTHP
jgi:uncharacterized cupredoxin-like copper-binding protein